MATSRLSTDRWRMYEARRVGVEMADGDPQKSTIIISVRRDIRVARIATAQNVRRRLTIVVGDAVALGVVG